MLELISFEEIISEHFEPEELVSRIKIQEERKYDLERSIW